MNVHELSEYYLYRLKAIDPALSSDWRKTIADILPKLDKSGQKSIYDKILKPRGIFINEKGALAYQRPESLKIAIKNSPTSNRELQSTAIRMLKIIDSEIKTRDVQTLADDVESLLIHFDHISIGESLPDLKTRHRVRTAFLYDLAFWIDTIELELDPGVRKLDADIIKAYFKEVYVKQQLQGRDFRSWNSADMGFDELSHLPKIILKEGKDRKYYVVEASRYWFVVGTANKSSENPYSFRRFLYEDRSGGSAQYTFLTHVGIDKDKLSDQEYMKYTYFFLTRLYTLDLGVSQSMIKFVNEMKVAYKRFLKPLLLRPLEVDGGNPENLIAKRLKGFEQQLSTSLLNKLPNLIELSLNNGADLEYLFFNLDHLIKQILGNVQDLRLQPLYSYSASCEMMVAKLIALREVFYKSEQVLCSADIDFEQYSKTIQGPLKSVKKEMVETEEALEELILVKEEIEDYETIQKNGSFFQKLKRLKRPEYTLEELVDIKATLQKDFYMFIVRLAKKQKDTIVYVEFDCNETINEDFRHYALADGVLGISKLPRLLRFNEEMDNLDFKYITQAMS